MNERVEKIKEHVREHKEIYIAVGAAAVAAGITWCVMRGRHADLQSGSDTAENSVFVRPFSFLSRQETNTVLNVLEREGRGHPGYMIRCLETNEIFSSQKVTAAAQGVSDAILSLHIRGKLSDINGLHFERIAFSE